MENHDATRTPRVASESNSEPNPGEQMEAVRLSNVNELTGNEQLKKVTLCSRVGCRVGTDTALRIT